MKSFKQIREEAGNAVGALSHRDHQVKHLPDDKKKAALKHHSLAQAAAMMSNVKAAEHHWREYHKLINGPNESVVSETDVTSTHSNYDDWKKHAQNSVHGSNVKFEKQGEHLEVVKNHKGEIFGHYHHQDETGHIVEQTSLEEGWTQGAPKGAWVGRYVKHVGGMGKVTAEHPQHVTIHNGLNEYPIAKHDVTSHFKKDVDLKVIKGGIKEAFYTDQASWEEDMREHGATSFERNEHRIIAKKFDGDILGAWSVSDCHGITGLGVNVQAESIKENLVVETKRKKFLGQFRGKTATGQKANPIDVEPKLKLKGKSIANIRKGA